MSSIKFIITCCLCGIVFFGCVEPMGKKYSKLPPGIWRGVLLLDTPLMIQDEDEDYRYQTDFSNELPFQFEVKYKNKDDFFIEIINGENRIKVDDIYYGRDKSTALDTIIIPFTEFDTKIKAIYEENLMEGKWFVNYKNGYYIPFKAHFGKNYRFRFTGKKPMTDISGKWEVTFAPETKDAYPAIGEFVQKGNRVTGTFMTETGDYRYLEGTIEENHLALSTFDGAHAFLFRAKLTDDNTMTGIFRSGKHYKTTWKAIRNDHAKLGDAFALTSSVIGDKPMKFSFKDLDGKPVTLDDSRYKNKVKLIKISGTWCPNCKDEAIFLKQFLKENPGLPVEVIEVAFERYKDPDQAIRILKRYKEKLKIPFTVLYGGYADKKITSKAFPQLNKIMSYPTLIFLDKDNIIRKVHTGFAGPATSGYDDFNRKFKDIISTLVAEIRQ